MTDRPTIAFARKPNGRALCGAVLLCAMLIAAMAPTAKAGTTDLSNQPLATLPTVQAKPNLLFVMDTSGSMNWSYMPDDLGQSQTVTDQPYTNWYGYWSAQCNGVAYDPTATYTPPLKADGTSYPNATFAAAKQDGYVSTSSTTNLANSYYYQYNSNGSQPRMGWVYTASGVTTNTFYKECSSTIGNAPGSNVFNKITMISSSSDAQNYANWYSYYRKRYLLMRTAMGRAMSTLDSNYRVGFSTIYDTTAVDGSNYFRDVKDFGSTQKANFYSSLYSVAPSGGTPLPDALAEAGRYFAKKIKNQTYDPMQYSCQRNYTLMSTDGYWNSNSSVQLDGTTAIGQQDGTEARPMRDNSQIQVTTVTPYAATATRTLVTTQKSTKTWTNVINTSTAGTGKSGNGCATNKYLVTQTTQTATETQTKGFTTAQTSTATFNQTVLTTDGVQAPPTGAPNFSTSTWSSSGVAVAFNTDDGTPTFSGGTLSSNCQNSAGTNSTTASAGNWSSWSSIVTSYTPSLTGTMVGSPTATGNPSSTTNSLGGSPNTLADVAEYYYKTDLRTTALGNCASTSSGSSQDVCANIVRPLGSDAATWQHMNTFTIGLGASGTLPYDKNYLTQTTGSYVDLTSGALNWPTPNPYGDATNIDDLWHAAVNGRGQYYSALNATLLSEAINGVVSAVQQVAGSASAASTSSLELVAGDNNQVFKASYTTGSWTGDLQAYALNGTDATIATTPTWSAQASLDGVSAATRKIYFNSGGALQSFAYGNLSSTQQGYFNNLCSQSIVSSQCAGLSTSDKALANTGTNLISYLSGVRTYETSSTDASGNPVAALYRKRDHVLGDIIDGAPVYVGKPPFSYADAGYADFVTAQASRRPVVYAAANDGMLHAFSAASSSGGTELWAYIPSAVMPNLYKLADSSYASKHQYYVDGAPVMADIKVGSTWKTILVGGLNYGGVGYYALDITDPSNPKALWEFTDTNLGYTFGNPVITKRADGTWVVAFASGYNNTGGDGKGHLYVLNANTGAKLLDIATSAGSSSNPSGLAKINAWVDNSTDNTAKRFYGGDLQGNLWRFDIDNLVQPNQAALLLAKLQVNSTTPQPITTKPEPAEISGKPVILVATGRYLGTSDISDTTQQSVYAIKDNLTSTGWGDVHADTANFVQQTFTLSGTSASVTNATVDWAVKGGWWIDLPHTGERVNSNMGLQFNTLAIGTAIPNGDACASGGSSWRYYLNIANGGQITTSVAGSQWGGNTLIVGMSWVRDSNGNVHIIFQNSNGDIQTEVPPTVSSSGAGSVHRTSWRELTN